MIFALALRAYFDVDRLQPVLFSFFVFYFRFSFSLGCVLVRLVFSVRIIGSVTFTLFNTF